MVKNKISRNKQNPGLLSMLNKKNGLNILILLVAIFIVFSPSLQNDFTNWDDQSYVTENEAIRSLSMDDLGKFGETYVGNYQPPTMIS